jgi:hypothetical protein
MKSGDHGNWHFAEEIAPVASAPGLFLSICSSNGSQKGRGDTNVTTYQKADGFVELSAPDKERMACLYEEVQGRLREMSLIVARTLNQKISERTTVMLRPLGVKPDMSEENGRPMARDHVEVHCPRLPRGTGSAAVTTMMLAPAAPVRRVGFGLTPLLLPSVRGQKTDF